MLLVQCNLLTFGAARIDLATEVAVSHSASLNQSLMDLRNRTLYERVPHVLAHVIIIQFHSA